MAKVKTGMSPYCWEDPKTRAEFLKQEEARRQYWEEEATKRKRVELPGYGTLMNTRIKPEDY